MSAPDPAIVAAIYNLDPETLCGEPENLRRLDGTPASPNEIEALNKARLCDVRAAVDMHEHALEQSRYELERRERIHQLLGKYAHGGDEKLGVIEQRMTLTDWVEYRTLWDELGNVMMLGD